MRRGIRLSGILCVIVLALAFMPTGAFAQDDETDELQEGQRKAVIRVVSITGNELTYYEVEQDTEEETEGGADEEDTKKETDRGADEEDTKAETKGGADVEDTKVETEGGADVEDTKVETEGGTDVQDTETETEKSSLDEADAAGKPDFDPSQMGGGSRDSGQIEGGGRDSGQMEGGGRDPSQMGGGDFDPDRMGEGTFDLSQMNQGNQETTTVYLPVAVVVHTDTGEQKTFSILEEGDELEVLFQENEKGDEVIVEMWLNSVEAS